MSRHLTNLERGKIIAYKELEMSNPRVANLVGCSSKTVARVWHQYCHDGSFEKKKRKKHHRATTEIEDASITNEASANPFKTAVAIQDDLALSYTSRTVRNRLREVGLGNRWAATKEYLTETHIRNRFEFANEMLDGDGYNEEFWKRVVFCDEKTFSISKSAKRKVWRPFSTRYDPRFIQSLKRSGRFGVNFFGYFNGCGVNGLVEIPNKFTSTHYLDLLKEVVIPDLLEKYPSPTKIYFVQDQCPVHKSKKVSDYLAGIDNLTLTYLPAKGSDMNPIENVWGSMVRRMSVYPEWDEFMFRAEVSVAWEWCVEKEGYFERLSRSMVDRLMTVIAYGGEWTKY